MLSSSFSALVVSKATLRNACILSLNLAAIIPACSHIVQTRVESISLKSKPHIFFCIAFHSFDSHSFCNVQQVRSNCTQLQLDAPLLPKNFSHRLCIMLLMACRTHITIINSNNEIVLLSLLSSTGSSLRVLPSPVLVHKLFASTLFAEPLTESSFLRALICSFYAKS